MTISVRNPGAEHMMMAAQHLERAALSYHDAAKCYDMGNDEKAAHHACLARGELLLSHDHEREAIRYHAGEHSQVK